MYYKQSIHYPDAVQQISSNKSLRMLNEYRNKWEIVKTVIYILPNGMSNIAYIDKNETYVFYRFCATEYPIIGEKEYLSENFDIEYK